MIGYMTVAEYAKHVGVERRTVNTWMQRGKLPGAVKLGIMWMIPANTPRPKDGRNTAGGRYKDWRKKHVSSQGTIEKK